MRTQLRKQTASKLLQGEFLCPTEYSSEGFRVRLSECGSVAYLTERPTRETRAEQYSDTVLTKIALTKARLLKHDLPVDGLVFSRKAEKQHCSQQFPKVLPIRPPRSTPQRLPIFHLILAGRSEVAMLPPGALFRARAFALPLGAPKSHRCLLPCS